jgi:hypothetical protein
MVTQSIKEKGLPPTDDNKWHADLPVAQLCKTCQAIFNQCSSIRPKEEPKFDHHGSYSALQSSADGGCGLCTHFILGFQEITPWHEHLDYFNLSRSSQDESKEHKSSQRNYIDKRIAPRTGILVLKDAFDDIYLDLRIPYLMGDSDKEHDDWSEIELICFWFRIYMIPAPEQG